MKVTRLIALLLVIVMVGVLFTACGKDKDKPVVEPTYVDPYAGKTHAEASAELYEAVLGTFQDYYDLAVEAETVSERYALMAIAEAKLLESGIMLPSTAQGGNYAISRVAPYTVTNVLWGNDSDRFHNAIIVDSDNPITAAQRTEMKAKWSELKGTGTYEAWAKSYLTGKGYTLTDEYDLTFTSNPNTWDIFNTYQAADSEAIVNTYDGLLEYDIEGEQQPALATGYTVSADGLTYTFTIRSGVNWVDSQGTVIEALTADSFVAGMQHMMDAQGGLEYLVDGIIKNASEYMAGTITDFTQVGVKATDSNTLVYTLEAPCSYFTTMLGYGVFAPLSRAYFVSKGGVFGVDAYDAAIKESTYTYGTSPETIAYCGPYLVTSYTADNSIVFSANTSYWNAANINIHKLNWHFIAGDEPTEAYDMMVAGELSGAGLNNNALAKVKARTDNYFETYAYVSSTDATSYPMFLNLYRKQYANYNDETVAVTTLTVNEQNKANLAMQNQHFRLAVTFALDRSKYNATTVGDELALNSLVNSYTPGTFVFLESDVTVKINGTDTTFDAGTYYGEIMQAQITADGYSIKVWDATADGGVGSSAGYDGWYNVTAAKEELAKAITELSANGMIIDAEHPVKLELPYYDINTTYTARANALKQSIEASLDGLVQVVLVKTGGSNAANWYYAGYYPTSGELMNYNIVDVCGWGPDYGDPATYLDTMLPQGGGMAKNVGLY